MNKSLITLDTDIKRCEDVLKLNDYLEIVIAVEELIDKYKNHIEGININNDRVWNYSKSDIVNILDKLKIERDKILIEYTKSEIYKTDRLDDVYYKIKSELENNNHLSANKINDVIGLIDNIYDIGKENTDTNLKWDKLKTYIIKASEEDLLVGSMIISLINTITNN